MSRAPEPTAPVVDIAAIRDAFGGCFGCGSDNPIGLQLGDFGTGDATVTCTWNPRPDYRSFPEVIHGGIVAAALDEVMAWTAMLLIGHTVVTGTMDLRFRRPAECSGTFRLVGRLDDHRGKRVMLSAVMVDDADREIASARAMFITRDPLPASDAAAAPQADQPMSQKPTAT